MHRFLFLLFFSCTANTESAIQVENDDSISRTVSEKETDSGIVVADSIPSSIPPTFNYEIKTVHFKDVPVRLRSGKNFLLQIPDSYNLSVAAEGHNRLRFLARSPDGRLFATDMFDRSDNTKGRVLIFEGWNEKTKTFEKITTYLSGLHNPNQVAFYNGYIYVAETDKLSRYTYVSGDSVPRTSPELLAKFPAYGLSYKYGGWHLTRSLAFHNSKLYVSIGSSCNACIEKEDLRASILEMDPDGKNKVIYANGLRNAVGIKWIGDELWATNMGRDLIGPDKPEDVFLKVQRDGYYGWPFYFQYQNKMLNDPEFKDSVNPIKQKLSPPAFAAFKAHSAPLGFDHFKDFSDPLINNSVLVCLHGSTSVWRQRGNSIVKVGKGSNYTEIVKGFLSGKTEADRHGRPCDVMMWDNHSFFFTDDLNGVLYYVWK